VNALTRFGTAAVGGKWRYFNVAARVAVNGVASEQTAFFCLHPLSPVRTTYPYSSFRIIRLSFDFVANRLPCRDG
jgi:hypothetical protein